MLELNSRSSTLPGITVLELKGRIATGSLDSLERELEKFSTGDPARLILDLQHVDSIDSQGVGSLIKARFDIVNNGGKLVLLNPAERVRSILRISGLEEYFTIATSESNALKILA